MNKGNRRWVCGAAVLLVSWAASAQLPGTVAFDSEQYSVARLNEQNSTDLQRFVDQALGQDGMFAGTKHYRHVRSLDGQPLHAELYYEITDIGSGSGALVVVREMEMAEVEALRGRPMPDAQELRRYGDAMMLVGSAVEQEAQASGFGQSMAGLLGSVVSKENPGSSALVLPDISSRSELCEALKGNRQLHSQSLTDLQLMAAQMSCFLDAGADVQEGLPAEINRGRDDAAGNAQQLAGSLANNAVGYIGEAMIDGRRASGYVHFSDAPPQPVDGGEISVDRTAFWIDQERAVILKNRSEGLMRRDGETKPIYIEKHSSDFRDVPNSRLYMPFRESLRMGGVLSDADRAKMAEAQAKLAEFDQRMAEMPAAQRSMMERMMKGQLKQMRSIVQSGAIEVVYVTTEIVANPSFQE